MHQLAVLAALIGWCAAGTWVWMALLRVYRDIHRHEPELAYMIAVGFLSTFLTGLGFCAHALYTYAP